MRLVVIIPCFNEESTISDVIGQIPRSIDGIESIQVLVVDDGSTDKTGERAREAGAEVLRHPNNLGLGRAFRSGSERALQMGADIVVNIDGDGQFDARDIQRLLEPILGGTASMATASRFKSPDLVPPMSLSKHLGNRWMAGIVSWLSGRRFYDVSCGFRAYQREVLLNLNLIGNFTYTQETLLDATFKGFRIVEIPMRVQAVRKFGQSHISTDLFHYGLRTAAIILRTFRDYQPMAFFAFLSLLSVATAMGLFGFLFWHFFQTGSFSPHKWAAFSGAFLLAFGLFVFTIGLSADMMYRHRILNERVLYFLKKQAFDRPGTDPKKP